MSSVHVSSYGGAHKKRTDGLQLNKVGEVALLASRRPRGVSSVR